MVAVAQPSPDLFAAVLQTMRCSDPWSHPLSAVLSGLAEHLTTEEAERLPEAHYLVEPVRPGIS